MVLQKLTGATLGVEAKFYRGDAKRQFYKELEIIRGVHHKNVVTPKLLLLNVAP